jgi:hypothetical protein
MWWLFKKDKAPFVPDKPKLSEPVGLPVVLDTAWLVRVLKDKQ